MSKKTSQEPFANKTCGECARYKVPNSNCSFDETKATDRACANFFPRVRVRSKSSVQVLEDIKAFFEGDRFIPKRLGDKILEQDRFITLRDNLEIRVWREGYYQDIGETAIQEYCKRFLGEEYKANRLNEALSYIRASTFIDREEPSKSFINLENGILDLETRELKPHDPSFLFFQKMPITFDPKQEAPAIKKFLNEIAGSSEDVLILEEMIGYCLYRSYPIHKALVLVGEGSNGKSTYLKLVTKFLGVKNVADRSLQELEYNRFAKSTLVGRLANIFADLPDQAMKQTGIFKMLVGGDPLEAEEKFVRKTIHFENYSKSIFSTNKLPSVADDTDAFFRRWLILTFPNKFENENCDPNILEKLTTKEELTGLLNLALEGLERVLKNKRFSDTKTTEEIRLDYTLKSDPLGAYVQECLIADPESWISKEDLFNTFAKYCRLRKLPVISRDTFLKNLAKHKTVSDYRPEIDKKRITAFKGVKFSELGEKLIASTPSTLSTLRHYLSKSFDNNKIRYTAKVDVVDAVDALALCEECAKDSNGTLIRPSEGSLFCELCGNREAIGVYRVRAKKP